MTLAARTRAIAILAGALAGFFGGLFGVGGGIVLVPVLTNALGFTQHRAHGTSLAVVLFTAITGVVVYAAHGNVDWSTGALVGITGTLTAPLGARLASRLTGPWLKRAFLLLLVLVAIRLLWTPRGGAPVPPGAARIAIDVVTGLCVGVVAGLMGVGGGIVAVPCFRLLLGMSQQLAQGTSLLVICGAATSGAIAHHRRGNVALPEVPWLALGAVVGGPFASWWVQRLPQVLLARVFAVFLIANAVIGWIRAGREAPRPVPEALPGR